MTVSSPPLLRLVPLGGLGTVTKNMYLYEYGRDVLIVDCGIGFPDPTMLGVDLLIPDVSYLEKSHKRIVGMVLTHGHDDHIGGLPYILPRLGTFPIFASALTRGFALDRLKEFKLNVKINEIREDFTLGPFHLTPIRVTHSVPDARHFVIQTPIGAIYHGSDFKFDPTPIDGVVSEIEKIAAAGRRGILCLLSDCLRIEERGRSLSERTLTESLTEELKTTRGRFIVTVMSSNVHRIQQAVDVAVGAGRRVSFIGRSLEANVKTATNLKFLHLPHGAVVPKRAINHERPQRLAIIIAGSQGQIGSSLERVVMNEHSLLRLRPEDKVVFASGPIPGNEHAVYGLIDMLARLKVDVAYSDVNDKLHVSGHAYAQEQEELIRLTQPKFLIPIGGTARHMVRYRLLAESLGYKRGQTLVLNEGEVAGFTKDSARVVETLPLRNIMVDGLGVGDVGNIVLRDRQTMAAEGIVIVIVPVAQQTGSLKGRLEIISRGFVFMKQSQKLVHDIEAVVRASLGHRRGSVTDWPGVRQRVEGNVEKFIFQKTKRRPLILTLIMEV